MLIDSIAVVLLILAIIKGLRKGLVVAIFSLLAFIIGLAAALKLSAVVAQYIGSNTNISHRFLPILAFVVVFLIVAFLVRLGAKAIESALRLAMLGWLNRIGGVVFYLLLYFFIFSIILFYATQLHIIKPQAEQTSVTYPVIYPMAPVVMDALGSIIPFFKNTFTDLENFFDHLSKQAH